MSANQATFEIRLTQRVRAPVERVWRACADPRGLANWQADDVFGEVVAGGRVTLSWPALDAALELEVLEADAPKRVVLIAGHAELTIEIEDGSVTLVHGGFGEDDELEGVTSSWRVSLAMLAHFCERHPDRDRRVLWMVDRVAAAHETAHVFFTESAALAAWLGKGASIGAAGSSYALDLGEGERMSGRVLANTPGRDVALVWDEDGESVISLRTLPRPLSATERMIAIAWSRWSADPPSVARADFLRAAHRRLVHALGTSVSA